MIKNGIIVNGILHELVYDGESHCVKDCSLMNICKNFKRNTGLGLCYEQFKVDNHYFKIKQ